jgi:hypothetical protein
MRMKDEKHHPSIEERIAGFREGIADADATGMVADEEAITAAETLLPVEVPELPSKNLHAALPDAHPAHATIDRLDAEVQSPEPNRTAIEGHVAQLRAMPELEAIVANWWESPTTQRFVWNLSQIGL